MARLHPRRMNVSFIALITAAVGIGVLGAGCSIINDANGFCEDCSPPGPSGVNHGSSGTDGGDGGAADAMGEQ